MHTDIYESVWNIQCIIHIHLGHTESRALRKIRPDMYLSPSHTISSRPCFTSVDGTGRLGSCDLCSEDITNTMKVTMIVADQYLHHSKTV